MKAHSDRFVAAAAMAIVLCGAPALASEAVPDYVAKAVHDRGRTPWDIERDALRKPDQVLAFSRVQPGMVVVDLVPTDGYYTRMLTKLVGPAGKVYAVVPRGGGGGSRPSRLAQRTGQAPSVVPKDEADRCAMGCYETGEPPHVLPIDQVLALQNISEYAKNLLVLWEELNSSGGDLSVPQQADVVFTADSYHELHYKKMVPLPSYMTGRAPSPKPLDVAAFSKSVYGALKSGGYYLVLDHAAAKGAGQSGADSLHRTDADAVKAEILAAGFQLDGESTLLANRADDPAKSADGTISVRDATSHYLLRFRKPVNAPDTDRRPKGEAERAIMQNYYDNTIFTNAHHEGRAGADGDRQRTHFYNPDGTYQEFGFVGDGAGPMQSGLWFWDADGHNCMLHEYPIDERANTVCHDFITAHPIGVLEDKYPDRRNGDKVKIVPGSVYLED